MYSIPECIGGMSCSSDGQVLVEGKPCSGDHPVPAQPAPLAQQSSYV